MAPDQLALLEEQARGEAMAFFLFSGARVRRRQSVMKVAVATARYHSVRVVKVA
jgi:hypothetical protein